MTIAIRRNLARLALGGLVVAAGAGAAQAAWTTKVETGASGAAVATMTGEIDASSELVVQCSTNGRVAMALILADTTTPASGSEGQATMVFKSDIAEPRTSAATIHRRNTRFIAVSWSGQADIPDIIDEILKAQKTIDVSFSATGMAGERALTVSAVGSTDASRELVAACFSTGDESDDS